MFSNNKEANQQQDLLQQDRLQDDLDPFCIPFIDQVIDQETVALDMPNTNLFFVNEEAFDNAANDNQSISNSTETTNNFLNPSEDPFNQIPEEVKQSFYYYNITDTNNNITDTNNNITDTNKIEVIGFWLSHAHLQFNFNPIFQRFENTSPDRNRTSTFAKANNLNRTFNTNPAYKQGYYFVDDYTIGFNDDELLLVMEDDYSQKIVLQWGQRPINIPDLIKPKYLNIGAQSNKFLFELDEGQSFYMCNVKRSNREIKTELNDLFHTNGFVEVIFIRFEDYLLFNAKSYIEIAKKYGTDPNFNRIMTSVTSKQTNEINSNLLSSFIDEKLNSNFNLFQVKRPATNSEISAQKKPRQEF